MRGESHLGDGDAVAARGSDEALRYGEHLRGEVRWSVAGRRGMEGGKGMRDGGRQVRGMGIRLKEGGGASHLLRDVEWPRAPVSG